MSSRTLVFIPGLAVVFYDCREQCSIHRIVYIENVVYRIAGSNSTDLLVELTNPYIWNFYML
jgi:hypothetical protein